MEDYAAKMQLKSDAALREYVAGYAQYRDEAVLAALAELRHRGQPAPEEAALRPLLEEAVRQQEVAQAAQRHENAAAEEVPEESLPQLYSPVGIAVISATAGVFAGAVLLAINLYRLKRNRTIVLLMAFVVAYLVGQTLLARWLLAQHLLTPMSAFLLDLPIILAYVWWFWPRYVGTYQFRSRNWFIPLGICLLIKAGLFYTLLHNPTTAQLIKDQFQQVAR